MVPADAVPPFFIRRYSERRYEKTPPANVPADAVPPKDSLPENLFIPSFTVTFIITSLSFRVILVPFFKLSINPLSSLNHSLIINA